MNYFLILMVFVTTNTICLDGTKTTSKNNTVFLLHSNKNRTSLQIRRLEAAARKIQNLLHGPTLMRALRRGGRVVYLPQYYFNDQDEVPSEELGPDRGPEYDPSLGHELYWVDGGWVVSTLTTKGSNKGHKEFLKVNDCSGHRCPSMYKLFGPVCGRSRFYQYRNFDSYCTMKAEDCTGELGWRISYRGTCMDSLVHWRMSILSSAPPLIQHLLLNYSHTERYFGFPSRTARTMATGAIATAGQEGEYSQAEIDLIKLVKYRAQFHYRYDPTHGYEPYWIDGEWILDDPAVVLKETGQGTTTEEPVKVCGQNCEVMFRGIKEVCVHKSDHNLMENKCWRPEFGWFCKGNPGERFHLPFETLPSYCHLLAKNCQYHFTRTSFYILAHIGKCKEINDWFKPMFFNENPMNRLSKYPLLDLNTRPPPGIGTTLNLMNIGAGK